MTYQHGVSILENPTSVLAAVTANSGLPVVFGTAPIHLAKDTSYVNKPFLAYSKAEAVAALGYSDNWGSYTLCEFMKSHFDLFNVSPVIFVNVLDPVAHKKTTTDNSIAITNGKSGISQEGVLLGTLVVKLTSGGSALIKDTDYTAAFDAGGKVVINRIAGGAISGAQTTLVVTYDYLDASSVTKTEIIGGINSTTGAYTGLQLVDKIFPMFRLVPGQIAAPGWSHIPDVAAVMVAKAGNINGLFKAVALTDVDSSSSGADLYSEVPAWKDTNSYGDRLQIVCWPKLKLGGDTYHLSTQAAGLICQTDAANDDIPYVSPSNRRLSASGAVTAGGDEVSLGPDQAAYLNGEGIVTALNFVGGWKLWGNRTGAYPASTDVKDSFIPVRRMFNWVANSIILTYWQRVDNPVNRRLIDTVVDSLNIWLNGLSARGALLGGRVEFRPDENPSADLVNGTVRFRLYLTPPVPAEQMEFTLEFDVNNLNALFAA